MKRFFDVTVALIALVVFAPLFAGIAALLALLEGPPILYRGARVGKDGCKFSIWKFRTMARHSALTGEITVHHDARVTPIGRLLRAFKLDELPQLINVLRGEMSLVGPRPESPHFVALYTPEQREVLAVRPGITGPAQVSFSHEERLLSGPDPEAYYRTVIMPAKLALDLEYVRRHPLWLDLKIIVLTLVALIGHLKSAQPAKQQAPGQPSPGSTVRWPRAYAMAVVADMFTVVAAFESATALRFLGIPIVFSLILYELGALLLPCVIIGLGYACVAYLFGLHRRLWQYASLKDGFVLIQAVGVTTLIVGLVDLGLPGLRALLPLGVVIIGASLSFLLLGFVKLFPRVAHANQPACAGTSTRVLIVGAGQAGADLAARFLLNRMSGYRVEAFVDDDPTKWRRRLHGKCIVGPTSSIPDVVQQLAVDLIAIALPSASAQRVSQMIAICQKTSARIKIMEGLDEVAGRQQPALNLREINVADLLGREVISLQTAEARRAFEGKTLLVTGAAGSIGSELCRQLLHYHPAALIAVDTNETGLYDLAQTLSAQPHAGSLRLRICDITDEESTRHLFASERPQAVFHAAAYKHVPLLEENPDQAVHNNILGTYRLCLVAREYAPERFIFISSDKAADPVSMLGASKRFGELMVQAMADCGGATRFCAVRFGNVIGSRGSVVPTFALQIEQGGPVTVTHPEATRYFMTTSEAAGLVIHTAAICDNGGLFLLDMGDPVLIRDLAVKMIRARGLRVDQDVRIIYTGLRPGERLHETLASADEQLVQTAYTKIFRVAPTRQAPGFATIAQWIDTLHHTLRSAEGATLRACLFEIITAASAAVPGSGEPQAPEVAA